MADPFIGEVKMFGFNFPPRDWALCQGGTFSIAQNPALFAIIGTNFGGDGRNTMGLPNLEGRAVMGAGRGPGLTDMPLASHGGVESVSIAAEEMPRHNHKAYAIRKADETSDPEGKLYNTLSITAGKDVKTWKQDAKADELTKTDEATVGSSGKGEPHENRQPLLALNFSIALEGLFPPRN